MPRSPPRSGRAGPDHALGLLAAESADRFPTHPAHAHVPSVPRRRAHVAGRQPRRLRHAHAFGCPHHNRQHGAGCGHRAGRQTGQCPSGRGGAGSAASAPTAARPDPSAPKPFAEVIKDAKQQAGFFPVWRKDEKIWLEIPADSLGKPFLLSANIAESVGERGLYGSQMGPAWLATFRRVNNLIQLVALNTEYVATTPAMKATVAQSFSDSLLAATAVASAPHPERKSVLVDASFLIADLPGYASSLEQAFRIGYGLDRANSSIEKTRVTDDLLTLNLRMHFATARLPVPPLTPSPVPLPPPPKTLPDPRSLFVGYVFSFTKLPDTPMASRETDPRVGHFFDTVTDLTTDLQVNPKRYLVNRWRLEKADPAAALSEPKQPIVFWLDRNIPVTYRQAVTEGILEWNKAFERIGFKNAIVAGSSPTMPIGTRWIRAMRRSAGSSVRTSASRVVPATATRAAARSSMPTSR
ncbi:DUF5117 domain-containing protein [Piscinibacter aquaticus]|uniref:DUF5117 domain-containing protein n=1 Tax=Piscinibacter aquaticus TaxID=392597 RepID=A0A5C6U180_9BURK|nr:DUF5117 domain-containing protein [Piscinibacter aquaticus]